MTIIEKKQLLRSLQIPLIMVVFMWLFFLFQFTVSFNIAQLGIYPLSAKGLIGIFTSPFIHKNLDHILSNTLPVLILGTTFFYFYRKIAYQALGLIFIITNVWVWILARPSYHIGMSGIIYGLASFLFFSGIIRKNRSLMAISLLVAFLYGSLIWGLMPGKPGISWESHLLGFIAGITVAWHYRKTYKVKKESNPQSSKYDYQYHSTYENIDIHYTFIEEDEQNFNTRSK